jgi:hypothetical protein
MLRQNPTKVLPHWELVCMLDISFEVAKEESAYTIPVYRDGEEFLCELRPEEGHIIVARAETMKELGKELQMKLATYLEKNKSELLDISKGVDRQTRNRDTRAGMSKLDEATTEWPI